MKDTDNNPSLFIDHCLLLFNHLQHMNRRCNTPTGRNADDPPLLGKDNLCVGIFVNELICWGLN